MSESKQTKFTTVREGCVRFVPSVEVLLARWAEACDEDPHSNATHILQKNGYTFSSGVGKTAGTYVNNLACPHCGADRVVAREVAPTPACRVVPGAYRAGGGSSPTRVRCMACGKETRPSALIEYLHPSKPRRLAFLEEHCGGARPQERRRVAAHLEGKTATAETAEGAIDRVVGAEYPSEIGMCLLLAVEPPIDVASLDLPYLQVPLSPSGSIKTLGWHGEAPTVEEETRYRTWHRAASKERALEVERRTRLAAAELEREVPLQ